MAIGDLGRSAAESRRTMTVSAIRIAMKTIERDIEKNHGLYPYNAGSISTAEVLRRAGLDVRLLAKMRHRELREEVNAWVRQVQRRILRGADVIRRAVTERKDAAQAEADAIRQQWTEAELEYVEAQITLAMIKAKCAELDEENLRLRRSIAGGNVVPMRSEDHR